MARTDAVCDDGDCKTAEICCREFVGDTRDEPSGREVAGDGEVAAAAAVALFKPAGADWKSERLLDMVAATVMRWRRDRRVDTGVELSVRTLDEVVVDE